MANDIQNLLIQAETAIENTLNDAEVQGYLSVFGYDEAALNSAKALLENASGLNQAQLKEYGDQFSATEMLNAKMSSAQAEYIRFVKVSRVAFKNESASYQKLGLTGARNRSLSGWLSQAEKFYTNALEDSAIMARLAKFGTTQDKLISCQQLVSDTKQAVFNQKKEMGEAQQATLARDEAVDSLNDWLSDFIAISRIAFEEKPQLLEKLGILERS